MLTFGWDFEVDAWSRFWRWNLIEICVRTCDIRSYFGKNTQPSGPLFLWQCLDKWSSEKIFIQIVMLTMKQTTMFIKQINFDFWNIKLGHREKILIGLPNYCFGHFWKSRILNLVSNTRPKWDHPKCWKSCQHFIQPLLLSSNKPFDVQPIEKFNLWIENFEFRLRI